MEKLHMALEFVGVFSVLCGLLARVLPEGKAKRIARDLGLRAGDAVRVLSPGKVSK